VKCWLLELDKNAHLNKTMTMNAYTQEMQKSSYLSGEASDYIEALYEDYLQDKNSVSESWRHYFDGLAETQPVSHAVIREALRAVAGRSARTTIQNENHAEPNASAFEQLRDAYRRYGHYHAKIDPLGLTPEKLVVELDPALYGFSDLSVVVPAGILPGQPTMQLSTFIEQLKKIYCGTLAVEYSYIDDPKARAFWENAFETPSEKLHTETQLHILEKLAAAGGLEQYIGNKYVGQKRFSLEGGDSLIPMLDTLLEQSVEQGVSHAVVGMAHRGRLNVLVNIFGKPARTLFDQFEGKHPEDGYSGDVKYHLGYSSEVDMPGGRLHMSLAYNPSHLEIVAPVVTGMVRARQDRVSEECKYSSILPIHIHGDAAFAGQGIVFETFALSQTRGYGVGGSIHIIINNQVGFTTSNPKDLRSSYYCTDAAKVVQAPVLHVNGDDPEAVCRAGLLALAYRSRFHADVVIDLVCYRRHGHNEGDEPSATQPLMYQVIKKHDTPFAMYAKVLEQSGVCSSENAAAMEDAYRDALDHENPVVKAKIAEMDAEWTQYIPVPKKITLPKTAISKKEVLALAEVVNRLPQGFTLQPQVGKMLADRAKMATGEVPLNWGFAELLAYASLLQEGYPVRLTGEDCGRGTFSHRHARVYDYKTGDSYIPLQHLSKDQPAFSIYDSVLSEEAVLAFEYGYAISAPRTLTLWEAQYGDFWNGAEMVVDQFLSACEQKWQQYCGLVLLLPHGYEGAGPEHSSARLERFMQLSAQDNWRVCVPSTPAQIFHLLRSQVLQSFRRPLVVMSPKSLLRHKLAVSTLDELATGGFQTIITDNEISKPTRVVLCSGKVYYDLLEYRLQKKVKDVALVRVEQLYPLPSNDLKTLLGSASSAKDIVWCQEEPHNQGAWLTIQDVLRGCLSKGQTLRYAGREASAAPATGYGNVHQKEQLALIQAAID